MKQIFPSSPELMAMKEKREAKYPWDEIEVGESFSASHDEIKLDSLRPLASRMGKKLGKKFRVRDHGPEIGFEVGRRELKEIKSDVVKPETFDPNYPITPELARYARENGLTNAQAQAKLIADGVTPWALKGMMNKKELEND